MSSMETSMDFQWKHERNQWSMNEMTINAMNRDVLPEPPESAREQNGQHFPPPRGQKMKNANPTTTSRTERDKSKRDKEMRDD